MLRRRPLKNDVTEDGDQGQNQPEYDDGKTGGPPRETPSTSEGPTKNPIGQSGDESNNEELLSMRARRLKNRQVDDESKRLDQLLNDSGVAEAVNMTVDEKKALLKVLLTSSTETGGFYTKENTEDAPAIGQCTKATALVNTNSEVDTLKEDSSQGDGGVDSSSKEGPGVSKSRLTRKVKQSSVKVLDENSDSGEFEDEMFFELKSRSFQRKRKCANPLGRVSKIVKKNAAGEKETQERKSTRHHAVNKKTEKTIDDEISQEDSTDHQPRSTRQQKGKEQKNKDAVEKDEDSDEVLLVEPFVNVNAELESGRGDGEVHERKTRKRRVDEPVESKSKLSMKCLRGKAGGTDETESDEKEHSRLKSIKKDGRSKRKGIKCDTSQKGGSVTGSPGKKTTLDKESKGIGKEGTVSTDDEETQDISTDKSSREKEKTETSGCVGKAKMGLKSMPFSSPVTFKKVEGDETTTDESEMKSPNRGVLKDVLNFVAQEGSDSSEDESLISNKRKKCEDDKALKADMKQKERKEEIETSRTELNNVTLVHGKSAANEETEVHLSSQPLSSRDLSSSPDLFNTPNEAAPTQPGDVPEEEKEAQRSYVPIDVESEASNGPFDVYYASLKASKNNDIKEASATQPSSQEKARDARTLESSPGSQGSKSKPPPPTPPLTLLNKCKLKKNLYDPHPYFAPNGVDPVSYTATILSYFNQYRVLLREAQSTVPKKVTWSQPVVSGKTKPGTIDLYTGSPHKNLPQDPFDVPNQKDEDLFGLRFSRRRLERDEAPTKNMSLRNFKPPRVVEENELDDEYFNNTDFRPLRRTVRVGTKRGRPAKAEPRPGDPGLCVLTEDEENSNDIPCAQMTSYGDDDEVAPQESEIDETTHSALSKTKPEQEKEAGPRQKRKCPPSPEAGVNLEEIMDNEESSDLPRARKRKSIKTNIKPKSAGNKSGRKKNVAADQKKRKYFGVEILNDSAEESDEVAMFEDVTAKKRQQKDKEVDPKKLTRRERMSIDRPIPKTKKGKTTGTKSKTSDVYDFQISPDVPTTPVSKAPSFLDESGDSQISLRIKSSVEKYNTPPKIHAWRRSKKLTPEGIVRRPGTGGKGQKDRSRSRSSGRSESLENTEEGGGRRRSGSPEYTEEGGGSQRSTVRSDSPEYTVESRGRDRKKRVSRLLYPQFENLPDLNIDTVTCPLCHEKFPEERIEQHAAGCDGPVLRKTPEVNETGENSRTGIGAQPGRSTDNDNCPVCGKLMSRVRLQRHVLGCLDGKGEEEEEEEQMTRPRRVTRMLREAQQTEAQEVRGRGRAGRGGRGATYRGRATKGNVISLLDSDQNEEGRGRRKCTGIQPLMSRFVSHSSGPIVSDNSTKRDIKGESDRKLQHKKCPTNELKQDHDKQQGLGLKPYANPMDTETDYSSSSGSEDSVLSVSDADDDIPLSTALTEVLVRNKLKAARASSNRRGHNDQVPTSPIRTFRPISAIQGETLDFQNQFRRRDSVDGIGRKRKRPVKRKKRRKRRKKSTAKQSKGSVAPKVKVKAEVKVKVKAEVKVEKS